MRMLKTVIFSLSLSFGAVSVTAGDSAVAGVSVPGNIFDKLVAMVNEYTKRVETADSMEELQGLFAALESDLAEFAKKNAAEIAAFDAKITVEQKSAYKAELDKAIKQFEKALENRAMQLMGE